MLGLEPDFFPIHVEDQPPVAVSGEVAITVDTLDGDHDPVAVGLWYSTDTGTTWSSAGSPGRSPGRRVTRTRLS